MSLFSRKKKEQTISVCTITTSAVHIAFVKVFSQHETSSLPVVLFSQSYPIVFRGQTLADTEIQILQLMKKGFDQGIALAGMIDQHVCVMSNPWVVTQQRIINQSHDYPATVSKKIINELVLRDEKKFQEDTAHQEKYGGWGIIARGPVTVDINGYRVGTINKTLAKTVTISYILGLAEARMIAMILDVYERVFHTHHVTFSAFEYGYKFLQDASHWEQIFICAIGGTHSELMVYERGVMTAQKTCSVGIADIIVQVSELFEVYEKHVSQVLSLYTQNSFINNHQDVYHKRIIMAYQPLKKELDHMMNQLLSELHQIPSSVIVTGLPQGFECFESLIADTLRKKQFSPTVYESLIMTLNAHDTSDTAVIGILEALRHNHNLTN